MLAGVVGIVLAFVAFGAWTGLFLGVAAFLWLGGVNAALYYFLRCPRCGKWACRTPSGWSTVLPGLRCRYCGQEY
jgi:hypothetical protein